MFLAMNGITEKLEILSNFFQLTSFVKKPQNANLIENTLSVP